MDYLGFYDLAMEPFRNDPDERFYFESAAARRAYLRILRGVHQHKGLGVLIGPPGCGKTTLGDHLVAGLDDESWAPRFLSIGHADCGRGWLLPHVAQAFEVADIAGDAPTLLEQIHERFVGLQGLGRHPVLIIDEAQLLRTPEVMEEFRALLNLAHDGRKTMSIVLLGLPELAEALALDAPLEQRVETRVEVDPLDAAEIAKYVEHRVTVAGATGLFTPDAIEALATFSGGVPRLVNTLADNALFESFLAEEKPVDGAVVAEAARQLGLEPAEAGAQAGRGADVQPEWMDSLVPPPETNFDRSIDVSDVPPLKAEEPLAEEEPELAVLKSGGPRLESDDFSMGAIVRDVASDATGDGDANGDSDFAIVTGRVERREEAEVELDLFDDEDDDPSLDLELDDDEDDVLELEPAAAAESDDELAGMETRIALPSDPAVDSGSDELELELEQDASDGDGEFDPSSLLDDDEPLTSDTLDGFDPSSLLDDDDDEPMQAAAVQPDEEEEEEDLDALFDEIQVPD